MALELAGKPVPVRLGIGDGLLYQGDKVYHWRDALPLTDRAIICFYHFVPERFGLTLD